MILWASLTVALFGLLAVHTRAEVVNSFQTCPQFFYKNRAPVGFDQNAREICQMLTEYSRYFYATLYSTSHKIPLYSAYTFDYGCRNSQDGRKSGNWFIEPQ
ncbi:endonuclease domain-containing 1 protein-like, partial [Clarias magur]